MEYVFVGTFVSLPDGRDIKQFGSVIELPEDVAEHYITDGVQLVPKSDFDSIGFTPDELAKYPTVYMQNSTPAPDDFMQKRKHAWDMLHDLREHIAGNQTAQLPLAAANPDTVASPDPVTNHDSGDHVPVKAS